MKKTTIQFRAVDSYRGCAGIAALLLFAAIPVGSDIAAAGSKPDASAAEARAELTKPGEPTPRISEDRTGFLQTSDGLTLRLSTDLGSVKIVRWKRVPFR